MKTHGTLPAEWFRRCLPLLGLGLTFLAPLFARAEVTGLLQWQPEAEGPRLILPAVKGVPPADFAQRWLAALNTDPGYVAMNSGKALSLPAERLTHVTGEHADPEPFLVVANRPGHLLGADPFLRSVLASLASAGASPTIVPIGLEKVLNHEELEQFHDELVRRFHALLSIGGGDIDPALYGQAITHARSVHPSRDAVEAALIRKFTARSEGIFYGICRGAQLGAATLGFQLIQDVPTEVPDAGEHAVGTEGAQDAAHHSAWHEVDIVPGSFLARAVGSTRMKVNSRHHQAVIPMESPLAKVTARAPDGTVEAIEFTNGRGVLFQFHPEDMGTEEAKRILAAMVSRARELRLAAEAAPACEQLLKVR